MVVKSRYPFLNFDEQKGYYISISITKAVWITVGFPFFGFVFAVIWSLLYNFEDTTFTHCKQIWCHPCHDYSAWQATVSEMAQKSMLRMRTVCHLAGIIRTYGIAVWNYLPSLSAAIGNNSTQYVVWSTCITMHAPLRFAFIGMYYHRHKRMVVHRKLYLVKLACALSIIENMSLLGLSYITSVSDYEIHEKCFMTFVITSELYMTVVCYLWKDVKKLEKTKRISMKMKTRLLVINITSFIAAGYFFLRHNEHCEPGVYTLFAFFEYIVVLSNMAFHLTGLLDFRGDHVLLYKNGLDIR